MTWDIIFGMTHIYIKKEWMVICEDVFQNMNNKRYWENVMVVLMEDIMLEIELHKRFYNQVFIGLLIRPFCITILYHNLLLFIDIFHIYRWYLCYFLYFACLMIIGQLTVGVRILLEKGLSRHHIFEAH
jgi:hypothetical protein